MWSMGITQHRDAVDGVRAIVNLGLARGNVGRDGAGLMPIRGHSGVQGGAEMGAYATALPGGRSGRPGARRARSASAWGFPVPDRAGPHRAGDGGRRGGGRARRAVDLGRQLPRGPPRPAVGGGRARPGAAARAPGRGASPRQMLADGRRRAAAPGRHPLRAGGRRHRDHHRAADHLQPGDPAPGRGGAQRVAALRRRRRRGCGPSSPTRSAGPTNQAPARGDRARRARLRRDRDARHHRRPGAVGRPPPLRRRRVPAARRPRPVHRARARRAASCRTGRSPSPPGAASSSTRWCTPRSIRSPAPAATRCTSTRPTPAPSAPATARRCGSAATPGTFDGHLKVVRLPARSLQVHWPEGNVLISGGDDHREPRSKVPDYNAVVTVEVLAPDGRRSLGHARTARARRGVGRPPPVLPGRAAGRRATPSPRR